MPRLRHLYGLNHLHYVTTSDPAGGDRARLFDSERFKRKFVTTLGDLRSRRAGWASASSDTFSSRRAELSPIALALERRQPHPPRL
jgi:hypothetical protein